MPDTKITALTALTAADPANDVLPIVDVSDTTMAASGTTKKISINNVLGASGTATLASATITGDLTVDTSTLKVDSANNRVGVGTASPTAALHVSSTGSVHINQRTGNNGCFTQYMDPTSSNYVGTDSGNFRVANNSGQDLLNIQQLGVFTFGDGAGGTRMTLNSTGLGVGVSPGYKLDVAGSSAGVLRLVNINNLSTDPAAVTRLSIDGQGATWHLDNERTNGIFKITRNSTACLTIDNSANVGIGVTPSAWNSNYNALDIGQNGNISGRLGTSNTVDIVSNGYRNSAGNWVYKLATSNTACRYQLDGSTGGHIWYSGAAGTAGNTIAGFSTAAMMLDASGNLLVKKTASGVTTLGVELLANGQINGATANQDNLNIYNTTAAAYRFYVNSAGTVFATNTTISAISDARFKENVQDIDVGLGAILALKPRKFDWKDGKGKNIKGDRGFIAQEFETVFPNLIDEWKENAPEGEAPYKSVRQDLIPVLVKAIQELAAEVNALKNA